jgi:uncharacterized membrane protein
MNVFVAAGAFAATGLELAEAALVVLVVISRGRRRAALVGASVAVVLVVAAAVAVGAPVLARVPVDTLRLVLGVGLLGLGSFWLLRTIVSPQATKRELDSEARSASAWAQRGTLAAGLVSAKAAGVETAEAAVLVVAIGAPHQAVGSAVVGAVLAGVFVVAVGARLERRLVGFATETLNRVAGTALVVIGSFWVVEGRHVPVVVVVLCGLVLGVLVVTSWIRRGRGSLLGADAA